MSIVSINPRKHVDNGRTRFDDGEIRRKRSDTLVGTLRREYGENFANGFRGDTKLATVLRETDSQSLSDYLRHPRVPGRPATARDTARVLGVSETRARKLISTVQCEMGLDDRCRDQDGEIHRKKADTGAFVTKKMSGSTHAKTKSTKARTRGSKKQR
jgi:hypothetical protein